MVISEEKQLRHINKGRWLKQTEEQSLQNKFNDYQLKIVGTRVDE